MDNDRREKEERQQRSNINDNINDAYKTALNAIKTAQSFLPVPSLPAVGQGAGGDTPGAKQVFQLISTRMKFIIGGVIISALLIYVFFFEGGGGPLSLGGGGSGQNPTAPGVTTPSAPPIPGLTLKLIGPEQTDNGQDILYTVRVEYDPAAATTPLEQITVFEDVPEGASYTVASGVYNYDPSARRISWSLSEKENQNEFTFTLKPDGSDTTVTTTVYATAAQAAVPTPGGPTPGGYCSPGSNLCSVENLIKYFGDETNARKASIICQRESGSDPSALNTNCDTNDYSVGLFQINLVGHCPGAYGAGRWGSQSCDNLLSESKRDACFAKWSNPTENIKYAASLQKQLGWQPWTTKAACSIN